MRPMTKSVAIASLVGVAGLAFGVVPASAAPDAAVSVAPAAVTPGAAPAALPVVLIKGTPAKYHPAKLTVAPVSFTSCSASVAVAKLSNKTAVAQTITYGTTTLGTIAAHKSDVLCSQGAAGVKYKFGLSSSPTAKFVLTLS